MNPSSKLPSSLFESIPWSYENNPIWIATALTLKRNLIGYNFPSKLPEIEVEQVLNKIKERLFDSSLFEGSPFFLHGQLSSIEKETIFEHFLSLHDVEKRENQSGFLIDKKGHFLATLNGSDHLELRSLHFSDHLGHAWHSLIELEADIGKKEPFSFSPRFGYLTSNPAECGTGLSVSAYLHLPALSHTEELEKALKEADSDEILFLSLAGDVDELIGDLIVIQNNFSIGVTEEQILRSIQVAAQKLILAEKETLSHLQQEKSPMLRDLTGKAFGLLTHSYQLETKEALDLLSTIKLALQMGWIKNVSHDQLSRLFWNCRRGMLSHLFPHLSSDQLAQKRAAYLQNELKGIILQVPFS